MTIHEDREAERRIREQLEQSQAWKEREAERRQRERADRLRRDLEEQDVRERQMVPLPVLDPDDIKNAHKAIADGIRERKLNATSSREVLDVLIREGKLNMLQQISRNGLRPDMEKALNAELKASKTPDFKQDVRFQPSAR